MATIKIGGEDRHLPALNLKKLKAIWPMVDDIKLSVASFETPEEAITAMTVAVRIIAIALSPKGTDLSDPKVIDKLAEDLEEDMLAPELEGIKGSLVDLLTESSLLKGNTSPGEASGGLTAPSSTEIGMPSSQNSLPLDAPAETGT